MKIRELEQQAKEELQEENLAEKKELLKERIQEIREARKVLDRLEEQYQELLEQDIED